MTKRTEAVRVPDGEFSLHVWLPEKGSGPGILLIQEIFGVGDYMAAVAEDLAALGYVVAAPDMFWRLERDWTVEHSETMMAEAGDKASRFDWERGQADLEAALDRLRGLPEVSGGVGAVGFCFGGSLAYLLAANASGKLDAVVSFYGSRVPGLLDRAGDITVPIQFHFGGSDPYIPREEITKVEEAFAGRGNVEFHVQEDGGHAFHNRTSPIFHQPEPAARAWALTEDFLARRLPVS
ncbi:dienelactone hydrolase family protein [Actinomadura logoneensis]|uniref:Dienelactone hydrolase family protein n=1 Tax=Actinomadura logoneensis TaxID=2293572 RepID=A0A372JN38_9ACTN|nr:dienelactone hydrolase family protein [Actinomadura logoneensis]RFU41184.1 dienelactone hydrolase family protein [Actinomadura logoneensis]